MMRLWLTLFFVMSASGCLNRPETRVDLDLKVGIRELDGVGSVVVAEGGAQVHNLSDTSLVLMGQVPGFSFDINFENPTPRFTITLKNCMPSAELWLTDATGDATALPLADSPYPTERTWVIDNLPAGIAHFSVQAEPGVSGAPFRVAFLSDVQEAVDTVQDIYSVMNQDPSIAFVVGGGDITHRGYAREIEVFLEALTGLNVPMFTTSGNHDVDWGEEHAWFEQMGRNSFHFVFRGVHFSFVDSGGATVPGRVYDWLEGCLRDGRDSVHIFTTHIPPIDPVGTRNASFASRIEAQVLLALLARYGVDLTLYGHIHSYYKFTNAGIPAYIAGGGGGPDEKLDGIGRHYLTIDVDPALGVTGVDLVRID